MTNSFSNVIQSNSLGNWRFGGFLGERIDALAQARITSAYAWEQIYPETEEAFRLREDDHSHPGRGVWRGEFWGKYILSVIAACRYYQSDELKQKVEKAVQGLLSTQDENGYIGTYRDSTYFGTETWNIWCRKYTLWGLLEAWELLEDDAILEAATRFADHLISEVGPNRKDIIQTGQFYGIPSTSILKPMVMLYRATSQQRFLDYALYIVDQWKQHPDGLPDLLRKGLSGEPIHTWFAEPYEWAKSYEMVSCMEGLVDLHRITGTRDYLTAAVNIHASISEWERSPVGSVSFNDKFIGSRFLINAVAEICDAVYWNRLSYELFLQTKDAKYIDEIERTLYNSLLCGMSPDGTWGLRRLRCTHEHIPSTNHFLQHHQCCIDNLPRGLYQAAEAALLTDHTGIYVALYQEGQGSILLSSGNRIALALDGDFLDEGRVSIRLNPTQIEAFTLHLRMPEWSSITQVVINGEETMEGASGTWLSVTREWQEGDTLTLAFGMGIRMEAFDASRYQADNPLIQWHNEVWASMGFVGEDNLKNRVETSNLQIADALPHQEAVMFFRGPLALARDVRLGDGDPFIPLPWNRDLKQVTALKTLDAPKGIWRAYELNLGSDRSIRLCDYASAGNTWDERSRFAAWLLV